MNTSELHKNLLAFDEEAFLLFGNHDVRFTVLIVGGSALLVHGYTNRATHDIDVLSAPANLASLLKKYDINTRVTAFIDSFPYGYKDRCISLPITGKIVDFFTPSLEDLVVSKLYAMRQSDIEDLESQGVVNAIDWDKLDKLVYDADEALASALSRRRYDEMVYAYEQYKERHTLCAD
ncbi:MAG: hypothetical protein LBG97_00830 [Coriobacteriales bacterium]|jgi:hypothetical protein|nr:hypothetical protein [Coriobacteriales bacterium]